MLDNGMDDPNANIQVELPLLPGLKDLHNKFNYFGGIANGMDLHKSSLF